ncbi:MAG: indole-3-glycerol phosphate synthase TrpC [Planctomycetes bacterium]|nr:indole-3-glycerol phosphate synthase TrpC [Planctomycetota bacterium]
MTSENQRTGTRLDPILQSVRVRMQERQTEKSIADFKKELEVDASRRNSFVEALRAPGLSIIAECKRISPALGPLADEPELAPRAQFYAENGARALSILTEQDHFGGSLQDFRSVASTGLPRIRKDFILDEWMVYESASAGAEAILLLAVCLSDSQLRDYTQLAHELGMAVLLEVHNESELARALPVYPDCMGVNARDLTTFEVRLETVESLLPHIPESTVRVAESGLSRLEDLQRVARCGADAALCGTALMKRREKLQEWTTTLGGTS